MGGRLCGGCEIAVLPLTGVPSVWGCVYECLSLYVLLVCCAGKCVCMGEMVYAFGIEFTP